MWRSVLVVATSVCLSGWITTIAGMAGDSLGVPLREKIVSSKMEPNILIAADATSCEVTKQRWERAEVGKPFLCTWSTGKGSRDPRVQVR